MISQSFLRNLIPQLLRTVFLYLLSAISASQSSSRTNKCLARKLFSKACIEMKGKKKGFSTFTQSLDSVFLHLQDMSTTTLPCILNEGLTKLHEVFEHYMYVNTCVRNPKSLYLHVLSGENLSRWSGSSIQPEDLR